MNFRQIVPEEDGIEYLSGFAVNYLIILLVLLPNLLFFYYRPHHYNFKKGFSLFYASGLVICFRFFQGFDEILFIKTYSVTERLIIVFCYFKSDLVFRSSFEFGG